MLAGRENRYTDNIEDPIGSVVELLLFDYPQGILMSFLIA